MAKEVTNDSIAKAIEEGKLYGNIAEIVSSALQREEKLKFLTLKRLGIK